MIDRTLLLRAAEQLELASAYLHFRSRLHDDSFYDALQMQQEAEADRAIAAELRREAGE